MSALSTGALAALAELPIDVRSELIGFLSDKAETLRSAAHWTVNKAAKMHVIGHAAEIDTVVTVLTEGEL